MVRSGGFFSFSLLIGQQDGTSQVVVMEGRISFPVSLAQQSVSVCVDDGFCVPAACLGCHNHLGEPAYGVCYIFCPYSCLCVDLGTVVSFCIIDGFFSFGIYISF